MEQQTHYSVAGFNLRLLGSGVVFPFPFLAPCFLSPLSGSRLMLKLELRASTHANALSLMRPSTAAHGTRAELLAGFGSGELSLQDSSCGQFVLLRSNENWPTMQT